MSRQPTPDRYDSETFGTKLQLRVRAGTPRLELSASQEAALLGSAPHFIDIKSNRLKADELSEKNTKLAEYADEIWPTADLYGISIPGHLDVIRSVPETKTPVNLKTALENIKGDPKGVIKSVEIDLSALNPEVLYQVIEQRLGKRLANSIRVTAYDDKKLKAAVRVDGVMDPDKLFTTKPRSRQWLPTLYGPRGEVIKSASELEQ